MDKKNVPNQKKPAEGRDGERQTDLAEGERDTVEESIRVHERKGDLRPEHAAGKKG